MSPYSSIHGAGMLRLVSLLLVFAVLALILWLFGHPSRADWQLYLAFFLWAMAMELLNGLDRRLERIEDKLDRLSKAR
jgi:4-hydroxybenzoate polyprenyltransferase